MKFLQLKLNYQNNIIVSHSHHSHHFIPMRNVINKTLLSIYLQIIILFRSSFCKYIPLSQEIYL